jgi:hypothetical protein
MLPLVASSGLIPPAASFCIYKGEAKRQGSLKKGPSEKINYYQQALLGGLNYFQYEVNISYFQLQCKKKIKKTSKK